MDKCNVCGSSEACTSAEPFGPKSVCFECWRLAYFFASAFGRFCVRLAELQELATMREVREVIGDLFDYIDPDVTLDRGDVVTAIKCAAIELQGNADYIHRLEMEKTPRALVSMPTPSNGSTTVPQTPRAIRESERPTFDNIDGDELLLGKAGR